MKDLLEGWMPILTPTNIIICMIMMFLITLVTRSILNLSKPNILIVIGIFTASCGGLAALHVFAKIFIHDANEAVLGILADDYWTLFIGAGVNVLISLHVLFAAITYNSDKPSTAPEPEPQRRTAQESP